MKVYALPDELIFADPDYRNYDRDAEVAREAKHQEQIKAWLISKGYTGKHTGRIYSAQVADGYAQYMFADAGAKSFMFHLPYGDAYQDRAIAHMSKTAVIKYMDAQDEWHRVLAGARNEVAEFKVAK